MTGRIGVLACVVFGAVSEAQTGGGAALRGEVTGGPQDRMLGVTVELASTNQRDIPARTMLGGDGSFSFPNVTPGFYDLTVVNPRGQVLRREQINVSRYSGPISIKLSDGADAPQSGGGAMVSVARLRHKVPKRALKQYRESEKELRRGDIAASIRKLEAALSIDPEFMEAYNDLGTRYVSLKEYSKALAYFQKAEELDPASPMVLSNEAISLYALERTDQAERAARRALQLDPSSLNATYVLGLSLAKQGKNRQEAIADLRRVQEHYPLAKKISDYLENQATSTPPSSRRF